MRRRWLNLRKGLLRSVLPIVRLAPPRVASRMVAWIGQTEYDRFRRVRLRVDAAVARGRHQLHGSWNVPAVARELAGNQIRWRTRDLLLDGLSDRRVATLFNVAGRESLDAALAEGRGVILLGNHFGAHLMPAHWLTRQGYPVRLFMERPRHISRYLARHFDTDGPTGQRKLFISRRATGPNEAAAAILRASRVLSAGFILKIAGDVRWTGPHTAPAVFLGQTYRFSTTWVTLAALTAAPVVPVFCRMEPDGSYHLEFLSVIRVPEVARHPSQAFPWVQHYLRGVEDRVRMYPTNSNEYFFWSEEAVSGVAGPAESG